MVKFKYKLTVQLYPQDGKIIANCPALDLCTCGSTVAQAQKRFDSLVRIFFEEVDCNDLPQMLRELGWKRVRKHWQPPLQPKQIEKEIRIPVPA